MKKILLFTSIILLVFSVEVYAQHPTNLQATNITTSSVDLSFDGTVCNNGFELRYRDTATTQWTTITNGVTTPYFLIGLSSGTTYDFSVKCSGISGWGNSVLFTTASTPEISNAFISNSILCNGGNGGMQIDIIQTNPAITYSCIIGFYANPNNPLPGTFFVAQNTTNQTVSTSLNLIGFNANIQYYVRVVDSTAYYNGNNGQQNGTSVLGLFDEFGPITFTEPDPLVVTATTVTENLCFADCIAKQEIVISGGTQPYSYALDANPLVILGATETIDTINALCEGAYSVVVSDVNGCSTLPAASTFTINAPADLVPGGNEWLFGMSGTNISCFGADDGLIENLDATTGGVLPYSYSLDDISGSYSANSSIGGLTPGSHTVYYKDANACIDSLDFSIIEPPLLELTLSNVTPPSCFDLQDGIISVSVSGGIGAETFTTDPLLATFPYNTTTISPLFGDSNYIVTVRDQNMCEDSIHVYMSEPSEIIFNTTLSDYNGVNISCFGVLDGSIDILPISGGVPPFDYSIDDGSTFDPATNYPNLSEGTYDVQLKDADGCIKDTVIILIEPGLFTIPLTVTTIIDCYGDCNGSVQINPVNAVGQAQYSLDNGVQQTTPLYSGLCGDITNPNPYVIDATDDNGCIAQETVTFSEPTDFVYTPITSTDEYCLQADGTASINVTSGGTGGYTYSWNDGQTSATATNLVAGNYHVTVTDVNGCNFIESISLVADVGFTVSFSTVEPCDGPNSGSATVLATGTAPYTYQWSDVNGIIAGANSATISNISIGTYSVVVEDATLCAITETVHINDPVDPIQIDSLIIIENSCFGINDAQIEILVSGGQPPYSYSNTAGLNTQTNPVFSNLSPGLYTIRAIDANGCYAESIDTLSYPGQLVIDSTVFSNISCFGEEDGSIQDIILTGGTAPFEYSINGLTFQSYPIFNDLEPGWYTVEVFDINNGVNDITCATSDQIYISEPTLLNVALTPSNWNNYQVLCNDGNSGYLDVTVSGGTLPYYTIYNTDTTFGSVSQITGLDAGNHTFIVEDANGCAYTETIMYSEPAPIDISFSPTHVSCIAWSDGAVTALVSGGVGTATSYTYLWDNGATTYSIDNLSADNYIIEVTDIHGCKKDSTVTINDNNALSVSSASVTNVGCYGECDGQITLNVSGGVQFTGTTLYNYQWNDYLNQTINPVLGLCADSVSNTAEYICVVTDAQGCELYDTVFLSQPDEFSVATEITSEISCYGNAEGKITATITGGTPMFTYSWGNGSSQNTNTNTNAITGLTEGQYIIDVVDNNGCMASSSIYLDQPDPLQVSINAFDIDCNGEMTGSLTALANGGTPFLGIPPEYEYNWIDENGSTILTELVDSTVNASIDSLAPGFYTVKVTDLNGCSVISEVVSIIEPTTALELIVEAHDEECTTNAFATAYPAGGTGPYTYEWSDGQTSQTADDLLAESNTPYSVTITDNSGCKISENITVLGFQYVLLPNSQNYIDTTICLGQSINLNITERQGLTYSWNDGVLTGDRIISPDTILAFNQNLLETYVLTITDENNCSKDVMVDVSISSIDAMPASNPGVEYGNFPVVLSGESIEIYSDNNNCQNYTWTWSLDTINEKSTVIFPKNTSWYYINVEDSDGCIGYDSIYVVVGVKPYEAITPNNDGFNDTWRPLDIESYEKALVQVFNRWGGLVFESTGGPAYQNWDGTNDGIELPVGTYYYIIDLNTGDEPQTGPITIVR